LASFPQAQRFCEVIFKKVVSFPSVYLQEFAGFQPRRLLFPFQHMNTFPVFW